MGILKKSIKDVQARMTGQIGYRINVVKGVVESGNINKTYNCYIAGEPVVYPNIPTLSRDPKLMPGDNVTIEFLNGCRETPAILAPEDIRERPDTTPLIAEGEIFVSYETGPGGSEVCYIKSFTTGGVEVTSWLAEDYQLMYNGLCVDNSGNVYYIAFTSPHKIIKYDPSGNVLASISASYQVRAISIASDGFIYTLEITQTDNNIMTKRNPTSLAIVSTFQLDPSYNYYGMAFLNINDFYVVNSNDDDIEMWRVSTESEVAQRAITPTKTTLTSLAVAGSTILGVAFTKQPWYVPTDLSAGEIDWSVGITSCLSVGSKDGSFYILGSKSYGGAIFLGKYNEAGVEIWEVEVVAAGYWPSSIAGYPF